MKTQAGFTALELIITVALAAVILSVGVPSFRAVMGSNRNSNEINNLMSALSLARSEAISRGLCIAVVPLTDNDWTGGWMLGTDINCNGSSADAGEITIRVYDEIRASSFSAQPGTIVFQPHGGLAAAQSFTFDPHRCTVANPQRIITVGLSGLVTLQRAPCP
ncbi:MAG: GspH/FimT family pseudopilin [Gammaproteobacteria bacterium]|nr:GspH/FimT family pseudopilin [Gammaproteobacteria bacterium]